MTESPSEAAPALHRSQPSGPSILVHRSWPEHVFHVLAHVSRGADLPASVFDSTYAEYIANQVGDASERPLAEDAAMIGSLATDHRSLALMQWAAQLFDSVEDAEAAVDVDFSGLAAAQPYATLFDKNIVRAIELLRCAALLEVPILEALPPIAPPTKDVVQKLRQLVVVSPTLERREVMMLRSLRLRGRLFKNEIWIGVPCTELSLSVIHVAWQAAHEASVGEVVSFGAARGLALAEREVEQLAVTLLSARTAQTDLTVEHAGWLSHFGQCPAHTLAEQSHTHRAWLEAMIATNTHTAHPSA